MSWAFNARGGLIIVSARLRGPSGQTVARLALDTGATMTTISWAAAILLGCEPGATPERAQVTTGSGVEFVPKLVIDSIEALGQEHRHLQVLCHTLPPSTTVDGVLGLDFFRGKRLTIDFRTGQIELQ